MRSIAVVVVVLAVAVVDAVFAVVFVAFRALSTSDILIVITDVFVAFVVRTAVVAATGTFMLVTRRAAGVRSVFDYLLLLLYFFFCFNFG